MGFGYLLVGYLLVFLQEVTRSSLPLGDAAQIVGNALTAAGCFLMASGIIRLSEYKREFRHALAALIPLFLCALLRLVLLMDRLFAWGLGWDLELPLGWVDLAAVLLFHSLLLPALLRLAMSVDLPRTAVACSRDLILVWLWGILYLVTHLFPLPDAALRVLSPVTLVAQLFWFLLVTFLLLSCVKNICPAGEEDPAPHRYRLNFLNRIGDKFSELQENAAKKQRGEAEEYLRRRNEKRERRRRERDDRKNGK